MCSHHPQSLVSKKISQSTIYWKAVRIIGFNTMEGWSRDVSEDVARELRQRCADHDRELPEFLREFVERCESAKA